MPVAIVTLLGGCATYSSAPLTEQPTLLATPDWPFLQTQASTISRPWLKPTPIDWSAPLSSDALAALAVINNPDLIALRARAGVADAQVFSAGLLPDPSFSFGLDKVLSGPDTLLNIAGSLGLDLKALSERAVTRSQANAEARKVRLDLAWAEWQTAGQARIQAVRIIEQGHLLAIAKAANAQAQDQRTRTFRAAARGDISASDAQSARLAADDTANQLDSAQASLIIAQQELARLLGLPSETRLSLAPIALPDQPPSAAYLFDLARANRSDLAALRAAYDEQEATLHKAVLDQFPSLNLTINPNRDSAGNFLLGPTIDFTLPLWNRNRGAISVEEATRTALKSEYEARLFNTRAEIAAAWQGIAIARQQWHEAQASLPSLQKLADATQRASQRGDVPRASAVEARQQVFDRQQVIAQARLAILEQTIALELLSGTPIGEWK